MIIKVGIKGSKDRWQMVLVELNASCTLCRIQFLHTCIRTEIFRYRQRSNKMLGTAIHIKARVWYQYIWRYFHLDSDQGETGDQLELEFGNQQHIIKTITKEK